jgi:hypothetical protein
MTSLPDHVGALPLGELSGRELRGYCTEFRTKGVGMVGEHLVGSVSVRTGVEVVLARFARGDGAGVLVVPISSELVLPERSPPAPMCPVQKGGCP